MNSSEAFIKAALYQQCANSPILKHVDLDNADVETLRDLINKNNMLNLRKLPILMSKFVVQVSLRFIISKFPAISSHVRPDQIRICIEDDEMQYLLTKQSTMQPNIIIIVAKNIIVSMLGTSIEALANSFNEKDTSSTPEKSKIGNIRIVRESGANDPEKQTEHEKPIVINTPKEFTSTFNTPRNSSISSDSDTSSSIRPFKPVKRLNSRRSSTQSLKHINDYHKSLILDATIEQIQNTETYNLQNVDDKMDNITTTNNNDDDGDDANDNVDVNGNNDDNDFDNNYNIHNITSTTNAIIHDDKTHTDEHIKTKIINTTVNAKVDDMMIVDNNNLIDNKSDNINNNVDENTYNDIDNANNITNNFNIEKSNNYTNSLQHTDSLINQLLNDVRESDTYIELLEQSPVNDNLTTLKKPTIIEDVIIKPAKSVTTDAFEDDINATPQQISENSQTQIEEYDEKIQSNNQKSTIISENKVNANNFASLIANGFGGSNNNKTKSLKTKKNHETNNITTNDDSIKNKTITTNGLKKTTLKSKAKDFEELITIVDDDEDDDNSDDDKNTNSIDKTKNNINNTHDQKQNNTLEKSNMNPKKYTNNNSIAIDDNDENIDDDIDADDDDEHDEDDDDIYINEFEDENGYNYTNGKNINLKKRTHSASSINSIAELMKNGKKSKNLTKSSNNTQNPKNLFETEYNIYETDDFTIDDDEFI